VYYGSRCEKSAAKDSGEAGARKNKLRQKKTIRDNPRSGPEVGFVLFKNRAAFDVPKPAVVSRDLGRLDVVTLSICPCDFRGVK